MKLNNVGQVIAERELFVRDSPSAKVLVRMGKPRPFPDGKDWYCPYQITAFGNERIFYAAGVDAFQAIELCFKMIGTDLVAFARNNGQQFRWEADEEGDLGFPFPEALKGPQ